MAQLLQLFQHLDDETTQLESKIKETQTPYDHDVFIASLELDKLAVNMDQARALLLDLERDKSSTSTDSSSKGLLLRRSSGMGALNHGSGTKQPLTTQSHRAHLKSLNNRIQHMQQTVRQSRDKDYRRYKEYLATKNEAKTVVSQSTSSGELKQRRASISGLRDIGSSTALQGDSSKVSMDDKLALQQNMQEQLSGGILGMVSQIKNNAQAFNEKVSQDKDVVNRATESLEKTSSSMGNVGSKLSRYQSTTAIGWKFYLVAALFMLLALVIGMTLIQLFPKW